MSSLFDVPLVLVIALAAPQTAADPARARETLVHSLAHAGAHGDVRLSVLDAPAGPFRFAAEPWFAAVRSVAPPELAARIFQTSSGRHYVPVEADRRRILALRGDAALAEALARRQAVHHRTELAQALGRPPRTSEIYVAHLLGAVAAARLIAAAANAPQQPIAAVPELARGDLAFLGRAMPGLNIGQMLQVLVVPVDRATARTGFAAAPATPVTEANLRSGLSEHRPVRSANAPPARAPSEGLAWLAAGGDDAPGRTAVRVAR